MTARPSVHAVAAALMRGGTSKGVFLRERLPDRQLALALGSPDSTGMQLDGLGGGISSTSKVAVVSPNRDRDGIDVDYLFGQVDMVSGHVDWGGSCGNLVAAVGLYAREQGLVSPEQHCVTVWQKNLGYRIDVSFSSQEGKTDDDCISIPGVPRTAPPIMVDFVNPRMKGLGMLPTGNPVDRVLGLDVSLCCCANPTVFVRAEDLFAKIGVQNSGNTIALPDVYSPALADLVSSLCRHAAPIMGLEHTDAMRVSWLRFPTAYRNRQGCTVETHDVDVVACITTTGERVHHAFTTTGMVNLGAMACVPGTIPFQIARSVASQGRNGRRLRLGNPAGDVSLDAACIQDEHGVWSAEHVGLLRTARTIMIGELYVPA